MAVFSRFHLNPNFTEYSEPSRNLTRSRLPPFALIGCWLLACVRGRRGLWIPPRTWGGFVLIPGQNAPNPQTKQALNCRTGRLVPRSVGSSAPTSLPGWLKVRNLTQDPESHAKAISSALRFSSSWQFSKMSRASIGNPRRRRGSRADQTVQERQLDTFDAVRNVDVPRFSQVVTRCRRETMLSPLPVQQFVVR